MSILVVDTSVVAQWYLPEQHTEVAMRLFGEKHELHAPPLLFLELDNVLCRNLRQGRINISEAASIRKEIREVKIQLHGGEHMLDLAFGLAVHSRCSMYDAVFLSLAQFIKGSLVTADLKLLRGIQPGPWSKHVVWIGDFNA